jgi:hypothetical protein
MSKYKKRPVIVEAIQFTGTFKNFKEIQELNKDVLFIWHTAHDFLTIPTPEGDMTAELNDWIIRGVQGECYPCKPDIFEQTYEKLGPEQSMSKSIYAYD